MTSGFPVFGASVLMVMLLSACSMEQSPAEANNKSPRFVAGEIIVKFKESTAYGQRVVRAMAVGERPPDIEHLARQLSSELDTPLTAVRVTSGRELLLHIDQAALAQRLITRIKKHPAVRAVHSEPAQKTVLPPAELALRVDLRPETDASKLVASAAGSGSRAAAEINALAAELAAGFKPAPLGAVDEKGALILRVNVAALTQNLVERLARRPDVEYAQVSHLFKPAGGAMPGR